ncbi:MAG: hypothetical protein ACO1O1_14735 [Adhaeribacter sp.]
MHTISDTNTFFLPGKENFYEQEAGYAYLKALAEEFCGEEVYSHRIFRLLYHLDGLLVVSQVGEACPVYFKTIVAIFETCCTYLVVSEGHIFNPLAVRKDQVVEVTDFRQEGAYLQAS